MKYNSLLTSSPNVSEIGLGAWQLGINSGWKGMTDKETSTLVSKSIELGINFFDTAPNYGHGTGELRLGKGLHGVDRDKIVINTKFGRNHMGDIDFSANTIRPSVEGSLKRLQMDYVDSIIIHNPPMEYLDGNKNDHYEILERLVDEGKIRAYGASIDTYEEMMLLLATTGSKVIEAFFNVLHQDPSRTFMRAKENAVGIIAKVPLDSGWLTGKYHSESAFEDIRSRWSKEDIITRAQLVDRVKDILGTDHLTQRAIAFCLAYEAVTTVIPGALNIEQLTKNVDSINHRLADEQVKELETFYENEVRPLNIPW